MKNKKNIGELIENEVRKQQISITEFAKRICCERNNVYNIFSRNNMDILQLKQISKVLNRNFFKEIADDLDLINDDTLSEEEIKKQKAMSQFFYVIPDVLYQLGKSTSIVFCNFDDLNDEGFKLPDLGLVGYYITFTIGDTLKERIGDVATLPIATVSNDNCIVEVCTNTMTGLVLVNVQLDYKTSDEWYKCLAFAFEIYEKYGRNNQWI